MAKRSKVQLYEQIRMSHERDELSIRSLAEHFGVHRRTVREALASPIPPPRKQGPRPSPALDPWKATIDNAAEECRTASWQNGVSVRRRRRGVQDGELAERSVGSPTGAFTRLLVVAARVLTEGAIVLPR
jgi:hypothetical protein